MKLHKCFATAVAVSLSACAPVSSEGLYRSKIELTIPSTKAPADFAKCVAGALPDAGQVLNDGDHWWTVRSYGGAAFERWDFLPTPTGSVAERRSGRSMASYGTGRIRDCAQS